MAPVVRKMCVEMETKEAIPHVIAGVESILHLPKTSYSEEDQSPLQPGDKTPALIAATWFFVLQQFLGTDTTGSEFRQRRTKIMNIFKKIKEDEAVVAKISGDVDEFWEGWEDIAPKDVQSWIAVITERDWLDMDWFTNIGRAEDNEDIGITKEVATASILGKRKEIGRTMQDEYDYLSPENKAEYQRWKDAVLAQIDDLIADGIVDAETMEE
jgi:origin recognition complex subunit 6